MPLSFLGNGIAAMESGPRSGLYPPGFGRGTPRLGPHTPDGGQTATRMLAATSIALWALANGTLLFRLLKYFGHLRVSKEQEMVGLDIGVNGAVDYGYDPADAPCPEFPPEYTEPAIEVLNHIGGRRGMPPSRTADDPAAAAEMAEVNEAGTRA